MISALLAGLAGGAVGAAATGLLHRRRAGARGDPARALAERQKEMASLREALAETADMQRPFEDLIRAVAAHLPAGFTHVADLAVRIELDDLVVDTIGAAPLASRLDVPVCVDGVDRGRITVGYRHPHADIEDGPFWTAERHLLEIFAHSLSNILVRKQTDARLARSEARFRALFENNVLPMAVDEEGRFTEVNMAAVRSFGLTERAEMLGRRVVEFSAEVQPDGRRSADRVPEVVAWVNRTGSALFDWTFRRADGSTFLGEVVLSSIPLGRGRITLSVWNDVTALRQVEAAQASYNETLTQKVARRTADLGRLNREFAAILFTATSGIALVRDMTVIRCNPALGVIFGTTEDQLTGTCLSGWFPDAESWQVSNQAATAALARGETYTLDHALRQTDGHLFWARMSARAIDATRPELGSVWVIDDVSLEVAARAEIEEARRLAEDASRVKAQFLANMSHEIRTPMNAILGFARLLQETDLAARQRSYLDKISAAGDHLLALINDILDFSKVEAGKLKLEQADLSLREVVRGAVEMILSRAAQKQLEVIVDIDPGLPDAYRGDPLRLEQILLNFLSNAVKFTERGEIAVTVSGRPGQGDLQGLCLSIRDTGIGIGKDQMALLFRSFTQTDASITRVYGGTGLGLAICQGLARLMGGSVHVQSALGAGSTFSLEVDLPRRPAPAPEMSFPGLRVILADDNHTALAAMARALEGLGARVTQVATAAEARVAAGAFDLALLDYPLPDLFEAIARLAPLGPVVLMVAPETEATLPAHLRARVAEVIQKPLDLVDLRRLLQRLRGQGGQPAPRKRAATPGAESLRGQQVLIVDDNLLSQELGAEMLRRMGAVVTVAENGAEAVAAVQRHPFDVVLMDLQMPVMGGVEATRQIRALPGPEARVPIIAMTANVRAEKARLAVEAGMNDVVTKPCAPDLLHQVIRRCVGAPAAVAAAPSAAFATAAAEVMAHLERGEFQAVVAFEARKGALQEGFAPEAWLAFTNAMGAFELGAALALLRQARDSRV